MKQTEPMLNPVYAMAVETGCHLSKSPFNHYFGAYYHHFWEMRENVESIIEIGVDCGESMKFWEQLFPNAQIHGIDIEPLCKRSDTSEAGGRIHIHTGSQADPQFLEEVADELSFYSPQKHTPLDIIIDDGSHEESHQRISLATLFPYLSSGGYYVIEDLHQAYKLESERLTERPDDQTIPTIINTLIGSVNEANKVVLMDTSNEDIHIAVNGVKQQRTIPDPDREIDSVHFYNGLCFIKKR